MRLRKLLTAAFLVPLAAVIGAAALHLAEPLPLQVMRNAAFDQFQRWQPRADLPAPVRVVDIDEESLKAIGQWPWPRTRMAELVGRLHAAGASAIAFDIMFAEPDRTSPAAVAKQWQLGGPAAAQLAALPDNDAVFAKAIAGAPTILGFAVDGAHKQPQLHKPFSVIAIGEAPERYLPTFSGAITNLPILGTAAAGSGVISFNPDSDGVVRRVPLMFNVDGQLVPSLSAEALRVSRQERNYAIRTAAEKGTGVAEVRIGALAIPTTPAGEVWVHYRPVDTRRYIPAAQVLADTTPAAALKGSIVLVGTSASGLMDLRASPLGGIMPGIEAHAQMIEQTLNGQHLQRPAWAVSAESLAILAGGLFLILVALNTGAMVSAAVAVTTLAAVLAACWIGFSNYGLLFDPVSPVLGLALIYIAASVIRHVASERRQRWVRDAFSRYVSPNLVTHLVNNPGQLELGGKRQQCSFVFTDLVSFTGLMEQIDPAQAVALLNEYLDRMIDIAFHHEGTLDRIVGDAVAIMFSAPVEQADHARRALACALEMHRFATAYADDLNARGIAFGQTRIGVHGGEVIVGNFGGSTMFDYRALGDPVNTASRLEGLNKYLGTLICVSGAIKAAVPDALLRPVGEIVLKGKSQALAVHEPVLDAQGHPGTGPDTEYERAYGLMVTDTPAAIAAFDALHAARPKDGLVAFQLGRLQRGEHGSTIVMAEK